MAEILDGDYEARVALDRIAVHPRNPRRGNQGRIEKLIEDNGFYGAIVAQRSTGFIVVGNHRMQSAKSLGLTELPVIWLNIDDDEALRILLGDNAGSDDAGYDDTVRAELLSELEASKRGLAGTGSTSADLEAMLLRLGAEMAPAAATGADDAPPLRSPSDGPPICQIGDVWLLGRHRLVVGDARDPNVIERAVAGRMADMVWTDPPYGIDYEGKTRDQLKIANDDRDDEQLEVLLRAVLGNARTWTRPGGSWWVAGPAGPQALVFAQVLAELKVWRQTIVWVKDQFVLGRQDYHYRHELLSVGEAPDVELGPVDDFDVEQMFVGWKAGDGHHRPPDRRGDSVWEVPRPKASKDHPTMKPVALIERAVRNHTDPGELVLDPFAGSGSTLIACHRAGRGAALVELDRRYADVICRRWEDHVGSRPRLEGADDPRSFRDG